MFVSMCACYCMPVWGGMARSLRMCASFLPQQCCCSNLFSPSRQQYCLCSAGAESLLCIVSVMIRYDSYRSAYAPAFAVWFLPSAPPLPSAHLHISIRCLPLLSGELAISFTGLLHQVSTGLWALEALPAAALTEMNLVYLYNAQRVT